MFNYDDDETLNRQQGQDNPDDQVVDLEIVARQEAARSYLTQRGLWPLAPLVPCKIQHSINTIIRFDINGEIPL
jgi:hypothetical protein